MLNEKEKAQVAPQCDILSVSALNTVDESVLATFPNLKYIASWGVGTDRFDLQAIRKRGILLTNTPTANYLDVADLAFGLMIAAARHIPQENVATIATRKTGAKVPDAHRVSGKRIGIAGLGHIGQEVALRAQAFHMDVAYTDRCDKGAAWRFFPTLKDLAAWCDILVLAMPANEKTYHAVNADVLEALGATGYLINVGRGPLVDTEALIEALKTHRIAGAALDVFEGEPVIDAQLTELQNLVMTPHIGGSTQEAKADAAREKVANIRAYLTGGTMTGIIVSPEP